MAPHRDSCHPRIRTTGVKSRSDSSCSRHLGSSFAVSRQSVSQVLNFLEYPFTVRVRSLHGPLEINLKHGVVPSGVTSKPAKRGHFKSGQPGCRGTQDRSITKANPAGPRACRSDSRVPIPGALQSAERLGICQPGDERPTTNTGRSTYCVGTSGRRHWDAVFTKQSVGTRFATATQHS